MVQAKQMVLVKALRRFEATILRGAGSSATLRLLAKAEGLRNHCRGGRRGGGLRLQVPEAATIHLFAVLFEGNAAQYSKDIWTDASLLTRVDMLLGGDLKSRFGLC